MSYCTNCGSKLEPGDKFCRFCGTKVQTTYTEKKYPEFLPEEKEQVPEVLPEEKEPVYGASLSGGSSYGPSENTSYLYTDTVDIAKSAAVNRHFIKGKVMALILCVTALLSACFMLLSLIFMKAGMQSADLLCSFLCLLCCIASVPLFILGLIFNKKAFNKPMTVLTIVSGAVAAFSVICLFSVIPKF